MASDVNEVAAGSLAKVWTEAELLKAGECVRFSLCSGVHHMDHTARERPDLVETMSQRIGRWHQCVRFSRYRDP